MSRVPPTAPAAPAGFTLVELVVVLLVASLALAVAVPALPRARSEEERAAGGLVALLASAREAAATRGGEATVEVERATGRYRVLLRRGSEEADSALRAGVIGGWAATALASGAGDSLLVARFDPLGRSSAGPLRWREAGGGTRELRIDPWTGEVRVASP